MALSIRGDNHDVVRIKTYGIYVPIIGLKMLNLNDESKSNVINSNMKGVYYVASYAPLARVLMTNKNPAQILGGYLFPVALFNHRSHLT
jgi:imidazoleglycerol phosphate synthase glutamine amidotransferase subunit HisH